MKISIKAYTRGDCQNDFLIIKPNVYHFFLVNPRKTFKDQIC